MERFELAFYSGHIRKNSVEFTDCLLIKSVNSSIFLFFIGVILKSNLITLFGLMPILSLRLVDLLFDFYTLLNSFLIKFLDIQLRTIDSILVCRLLFVFELIELFFRIGLIQCLMCQISSLNLVFDEIPVSFFLWCWVTHGDDGIIILIELLY